MPWLNLWSVDFFEEMRMPSTGAEGGDVSRDREVSHLLSLVRQEGIGDLFARVDTMVEKAAIECCAAHAERLGRGGAVAVGFSQCRKQMFP